MLHVPAASAAEIGVYDKLRGLGFDDDEIAVLFAFGDGPKLADIIAAGREKIAAEATP